MNHPPDTTATTEPTATAGPSPAAAAVSPRSSTAATRAGRSASRLVLGTWLRQRRLGTGLTTGQVAHTLGCTTLQVEQAESGHRAALGVRRAQAFAETVGIRGEAGLAAVRHLAVQREPLFTDVLPGAAERLRAVEDLAVDMTAVALGPLWPRQWEWDPPAPGPEEPRPWPGALATLVLQDQLLARPHGCTTHTAWRLNALARRAEDTMDVRIVSCYAPELVGLAQKLGILCSRLVLPGGDTLYLNETYSPAYRTPTPEVRAALDALLAVTVGGPLAVTALRTAARRHARAECGSTGPIPATCRCPPATERPPARETVAAVVSPHGSDDVLLVTDRCGAAQLPQTRSRELETPATAAVRAVHEQTGLAVIATAEHTSPGPVRHILCTLPGPKPPPARTARWAQPAEAHPLLSLHGKESPHDHPGSRPAPAPSR
ncbi:hypothetical protein ACIQNG_34225 [Streptomyces sp. NPDC091377]|uniref:hypothetical protein n=1 Tax=Streptomyces sp. NPDC091377 TaxID=3365995 RepID=UPI00381B6880